MKRPDMNCPARCLEGLRLLLTLATLSATVALAQDSSKLTSLTVEQAREVMTKKNKVVRLENFKLEPEIDKLGKIEKAVQKGHLALVQVVKEPISTKGPRLSCDISIAGRFLVLVPFANGVNISKKITSKLPSLT